MTRAHRTSEARRHADLGSRPAAALPAVALRALGLHSACAGAGPARPMAEIADDGPDCTATDVLGDLGLRPPTGDDRPGPAAGAVPPGFDPVAVVECTAGPADLSPLDPPPAELSTAVPGAVPEDPASAPEHTGVVPNDPAPDATPTVPTAITVTLVERRGDLGPLLRALSRPSEPARADQACMAMWESRPVIYLLDAEGRAVRAQWPTTSCGFLLDGATASLAAIPTVGSTEQTVPLH